MRYYKYNEDTKTIDEVIDHRELFSSITSLPTSTTDFKVNSGRIESAHTSIQDGKYKVIGPYPHGVDTEAPPAIILSETDAVGSKVNYMEDIVLLSMLNRQYENHLSEDKTGEKTSPIEDHNCNRATYQNRQRNRSCIF